MDGCDMDLVFCSFTYNRNTIRYRLNDNSLITNRNSARVRSIIFIDQLQLEKEEEEN